MRIIYLENIQDYRNYLNTDEETVLFVRNLTYHGIFILDEMKKLNKTIYCGKVTRHVKDSWFNYNISGSETPIINEYQWKNVKLRSYEPLLGDHDYTKEQIEEALNYIYQNFPGVYGSFAKTPSSCIEKATNLTKKFMSNKNKKVIEFSHNAFQPGAVHIFPQYINQTIPYETHLDIRQAYASILKNNIFPAKEPEYITNIKDLNPNLPFIVHIIGGKIKLKPNGYPLIQSNQKMKNENLDKHSKTTMAFDEYDKVYNIFDIFCGLYLTSPAYQVLLDNYDIIEPLEILDAMQWPAYYSDGIMHTIINRLYELRTTTTNPALKNFAKLCNEYCAGLLERKVTMNSNCWIDLDGTKQKNENKKTMLDCSIGDFVTDYLRLQISNILQLLPHDWIIGYDTDGIFINKTQKVIKPLVAHLLGNKPGQCHFDAEYKQVTHIANKQYYGYTIDGKVFGKLAGVNNGDEVAQQLLNDVDKDNITSIQYRWNGETHEYELTTVKANIALNLEEKNYEQEI